MKANNTPNVADLARWIDLQLSTIIVKQTLKAAAALLGTITAAVILNYFIKALGCLMIYISENYNVPL